MSLRLALDGGRLNDLPGRRDEDWRWTDLRAVIDVLPPRSPPGPPPVASLYADGFEGARRLFVNGRPHGPHEALVSGRLVRRFVSTSPGGGHDVDDDLTVAEGASLVVLDIMEGQCAGYVSNVRGVITLGAGARVERLVLCEDAEDAVSVSRFDVDVGPGAAFSQTVLCSGARRQRVETEVNVAQGGRLRLDGAYLLSGRRHGDQTTRVTHSGRDGFSRQLVKGLAGDGARAVFQGRITVARGAAGADARLGSHGLLLGERAEIDAKPELEIYADDVKCAHGNTVGSLDPETVFYLRSRGLSAAEAKRLLAAGFVGEVSERIEDVALRALAESWRERRLGDLV